MADTPATATPSSGYRHKPLQACKNGKPYYQKELTDAREKPEHNILQQDYSHKRSNREWQCTAN